MFAVSPAIPARWAGRRWVGPVVVTIVGAVGGLALLWVWLWLVLSTNMRHIKEMRELIV